MVFRPLLCLSLVAGLFCSVSCSQQNQPSTTTPQLSDLLAKGRSLLGQSKNKEAEAVFREATKKYSKSPGPWYLLGYTLHAQKQYDEALICYERSQSSARLKATSLYNMACIYSAKNEKDKAFSFLDKAIKAGFKNFGQMEADAEFANIKDDVRFRKLLPKKLADDDLFVEPTRIIHKWVGETAGDQFGWTARRAGDIDRDGVLDLVATAPTFNQGAGKIYVYSGKSGKEILAKAGQPGERLGNSAVGVGDVDGDRIPDLLAGAPGGKGKAYLISGKNGSVLREFTGTKEGGQFGYEVSGAGDIDGDQVPDLLVGEMNGDGTIPNCGKAIVYSGKTGKKIFELAGERNGDGFGNAAAIVQTKKNESLLAIGAQNAGPNKRGRVYVYLVKDAKPVLRFKIEGDKNSVNLGQMFISFPGDLDGDGTPDVYASDFGDNTKVRGGGKVVIHSGATGKELLSIHSEIQGEGLGTSPSDAGDVDGDGIGDLVIGAWQNNQGAASGGKVYLYSCANGKLLRSWTCKQSGDTFGFDACGIGDVDGDGKIDFLLTSAWSNAKGPKTGRVFIVAGE